MCSSWFEPEPTLFCLNNLGRSKITKNLKNHHTKEEHFEGFFQQIIQGEFKNLKIDQQLNKRLELNYSLLKSFIKSI